MSTRSISGTVRGLGSRANPAFAGGTVALSVLAIAYIVSGAASLTTHMYIHVMAGVLWTGTDLFMGAVLGPVTGGLEEEESAALFTRLTPKTTFFLPAMALLTIVGGITLSIRMGYFPNSEPWMALFTAANLLPALLLAGWRLNAYDDRRWQVLFGVSAVASLAWVATTVGGLEAIPPVIGLALAIVTVLSVVGFGFLMPGEIRMYAEMTSADPDAGIISRIGSRNAKLGAVQGVFQLGIIVLMVTLRVGGA